jgi:hypothetical protein
MHHRVHSITPTQSAITGALGIFVEGHRNDNVRQMLFGLSVLQSGTETQVHAAMPFVQASQQTTRAEIDAMLAR